MVSGPFDLGPVRKRGGWAKMYSLPSASDRVHALAARLQGAMGFVGKDYRVGLPNRTMMTRARVEVGRGGILTAAPGSLVTPVIGDREHEALLEVVRRGGMSRLSQAAREGLRGPASPEEVQTRQRSMLALVRVVADLAEAHTSKNPFRQREGVATLAHGWVRDRNLAYLGMRSGYLGLKSMDEQVAESLSDTDNRFGGFHEAIAGGWTAEHFDAVLAQAEESGAVREGTAESLRLGWAEADSAARLKILGQVDFGAPAGYAFAGLAAERASLATDERPMTTGRVLHLLNNQALHHQPATAAGLLLRGSEVMRDLYTKDPAEHLRIEGDVADLLKDEFETVRNARYAGLAMVAGIDGGSSQLDAAERPWNGGLRAGERALALIAEYEQEVGRPSSQVLDLGAGRTAMDPREGVAAFTSVSAPTGSAADGTAHRAPVEDRTRTLGG